MPQHGRENRRTPRRAFERPIGYLFGGAYEIVQALQISEGGMLIEIRELPPVKSTVVLTIIVPMQRVVVLTAEVVHHRSFQGRTTCGVRFLNINLADRRLIRNYVSARTVEEAMAESGDEGV